jgi:hypothetical protein
VNTFHYRIAEQVVTEDEILEALVDGFITDIQPMILARYVDTAELIGYKAFRTTGEPKRPYFTRVDESGTVVADPQLSTAARVVTFYTQSANHRRRGRLMLSCGSVAMFSGTDGSVETVEVLAMQNLGAACIAEIFSGGNEFKLCIPPTEVLPYEDITSALARNTPASIRSRRIKRFYVG